MLSVYDKTNLQQQKHDAYDLLNFMFHRAWIEINEDNLTYNIKQFKKFVSPQTNLMAVVKADAYGHGAVSVAKKVLKAGATWLAIATLGEGIELRQAGITSPRN